MGPARLFAVIVVLVLVLMCLYGHLGLPLRALPGFWSAGDGYLREAGLTDMCLYLAERPVGAWGKLTGRATYDAFLLIATSDGLVCNQSARARFCTGARLTAPNSIDGSCRFDFSDPDESPWPEKLRFTFHPLAGILCLHDGDSMLAYLHRDAAASEAAALAQREAY